jgi:hypothetical protein
MYWRWKSIIPVKEVFDEIIDMDHGIKKAIYGEWTSLAASSRRMNNGLYSREGISDYHLRQGSRLPISVNKLNDYILARAETFNQARVNFKDVFLCPFGCSAHQVGADRWEKPSSGVDYYINGRFFNIRRGTQSRQVLTAEMLEVGDYVASVVKADAGYELAIPDEISYVDSVNCDPVALVRINYPHLINLTSERGSFPSATALFVRMPESEARGLVEARVLHVESLPSPPLAKQSSPSIGNNRIIDLGGL